MRLQFLLILLCLAMPFVAGASISCYSPQTFNSLQFGGKEYGQIYPTTCTNFTTGNLSSVKLIFEYSAGTPPGILDYSNGGLRFSSGGGCSSREQAINITYYDVYLSPGENYTTVLGGVFYYGAGCGVILLERGFIKDEATGAKIDAIGNVTIEYFNSTHYKVNNSTTTAYFTNNGNVTFRTGNSLIGESFLPHLHVNTLRGSIIGNNSWDYALSLVNSPIRINWENNSSISRVQGEGFTGSDRIPGTGKYNAVLVGSSQVLAPVVSYYPATARSFTTTYNNVTGIIQVINNTPLYAFDSNTLGWYFCPAFAATDTTLVYTITCISTPSVSNIGVLNMPAVFPIQACSTYGNTFTWNIVGTTSNTFTLQYALSNNSVHNSQFNGVQYQSSVNLSYPNATLQTLNISANGAAICSYSSGNNSSVFFSGISFLSNNVTKTTGQIFYLALSGIGVFVPYATIGAFFVNDIFGLYSQSLNFVVFGIVAVSGIMINYRGDKNLKSVAIYAAIGVTILSAMILQGTGVGLGGLPDLTGVSTKIAEVQAAVNDPSSNLLLFAYTAVTSGIGIIIDIILFILLLPATLVSIIINPLAQINQNLYNAVSPFGIVLTFGAYLWIVLKAYEILSNRFRSI